MRQVLKEESLRSDGFDYFSSLVLPIKLIKGCNTFQNEEKQVNCMRMVGSEIKGEFYGLKITSMRCGRKSGWHSVVV